MSYYVIEPQVDTVGKIGRLQSLLAFPVIAGDSLDIALGGELYFSQLRHRLKMDAKLDIGFFFTPYRHIWGDDWVTFIKDGMRETVSLATTTGLASTPEYLAWRCGTSIFKPVLASYNRIWNRYWRHPKHETAELSDSAIETGDGLLYGRHVTQLPEVITGAAKVSFTDDDHKTAVTNGKIDVIELEKTAKRYESEIDREWNLQDRYTDIMQGIWGKGVNIDADERPVHLWQHEQWFGGNDVEGTADANQGNLQGRMFTDVQVRLPGKDFNEHGILTAVMTVRWPFVHMDERHYFQKVQNPSYTELAGEMRVMSAEPPVDEVANDYFDSTDSTTVIGQQPFGQHYRFHPNYIHSAFEKAKGYPYINKSDAITNTNMHRIYVDSEFYDSVFHSPDLYGHYTFTGQWGIMASRQIPEPITSVYAGSR